MTKTFRNILFSLLVISLVCGCATKQSQQYKKIDKYLTTHFKQYDPTAKNCVLVLNEQACLSCVREFAEVMQGFVNVPNKYIVICAGGSMVDISPFVNNTTATNVYDDPKFSFTKEIYPTPAAIFMENDKIDTIVNISAYDLEKTLMFIKQKAGF